MCEEIQTFVNYFNEETACEIRSTKGKCKAESECNGVYLSHTSCKSTGSKCCLEEIGNFFIFLK
jgi:hypothetical protein